MQWRHLRHCIDFNSIFVEEIPVLKDRLLTGAIAFYFFDGSVAV